MINLIDIDNENKNVYANIHLNAALFSEMSFDQYKASALFVGTVAESQINLHSEDESASTDVQLHDDDDFFYTYCDKYIGKTHALQCKCNDEVHLLMHNHNHDILKI